MPPVVPIITPDGRSRPLPTPQLPGGAGPSAFGGGLAAGLLTLGGTIRRVAEEERARADSIVLTEAMGSLDALELEHGTTARNRRGRDVVGLGDPEGPVATGWRAGVQKIREKLTGEGQRGEFDRIATGRTAAFMDSMARFERTELDRADTETTTATIESARSRAAASLADPGTVGGALAETDRVIRWRGARMGWDPATLNRALAEGRSALHVAVLAPLVDASSEAASKYLAANRGDMLAEDVTRVQGPVNSGKLRARGIREGDRIYESADGDLDVALGLARKIEDAELAVEVEERIRRRATDTDAAKRQDRQADLEAADEAFKRRWSVSDIPASVRGRLSSGDLESFRDAERRYRDAQSAPEPTISDPGVLQAYGEWLSLSDDDKKYADPVKMLYGRVPARLIESAVEEQARLRRPPKAGKGWSLNTVLGRVDAAAKATGFYGFATKRPVRDRRRGELTAWVGEQIEGLQDEDGNYPPDAVIKVIDAALLEGSVPGRLWGTTELRQFQAGEREFTPEEPRPGSSVEVPSLEAARPEIERALRALGVEPTEEQIRATYERGVRRIGVAP